MCVFFGSDMYIHNEQHWSAEPSVQARCVRCCSCQCKDCSCASEALLLALWTLSLSFVTNNSSLDSKAFLRFIAFSDFPTAVHRAFLFFKGMATVTNWPLCVHYDITLWAYLSQTHRPNLRYCTVGIAFWASRKRQSQMSKFDRKTTIPRAPTHLITHLSLRTCYGEVYRNIAHEENGWLSAYSASNLWTKQF